MNGSFFATTVTCDEPEITNLDSDNDLDAIIDFLSSDRSWDALKDGRLASIPRKDWWGNNENTVAQFLERDTDTVWSVERSVD